MFNLSQQGDGKELQTPKEAVAHRVIQASSGDKDFSWMNESGTAALRTVEGEHTPGFRLDEAFITVGNPTNEYVLRAMVCDGATQTDGMFYAEGALPIQRRTELGGGFLVENIPQRIIEHFHQSTWQPGGDLDARVPTKTELRGVRSTSGLFDLVYPNLGTNHGMFAEALPLALKVPLWGKADHVLDDVHLKETVTALGRLQDAIARSLLECREEFMDQWKGKHIARAAFSTLTAVIDLPPGLGQLVVCIGDSLAIATTEDRYFGVTRGHRPLLLDLFGSPNIVSSFGYNMGKDDAPNLLIPNFMDFFVVPAGVPGVKFLLASDGLAEAMDFSRYHLVNGSKIAAEYKELQGIRIPEECRGNPASITKKVFEFSDALIAEGAHRDDRTLLILARE